MVISATPGRWVVSRPAHIRIYNTAAAGKRGIMDNGRKVILYHSPQTRSSATLILLEELGAPYELHALNMKAGEQRRPAYLAINPIARCRR